MNEASYGPVTSPFTSQLYLLHSDTLHVTLHVPFTDLHGLRENDRSVTGVGYRDVTNPGYSLCRVSYGTHFRDRLENQMRGFGHKSHVTFTEPSRYLHGTFTLLEAYLSGQLNEASYGLVTSPFTSQLHLLHSDTLHVTLHVPVTDLHGLR